jgi:HD-like signal output (HDOD) protein
VAKSREDLQRDLRTKVSQLPTLPTVVNRILNLLNNPKTNGEDISQLIENDVALTSMVLKLANSAYYGIPQTISSIRTATVILGFNAIKSLLVPVAMARFFPKSEGKSLFSWENFWIHSVEVGVLARALSKQERQTLDAEQMFTAGLLHDLGRLLLRQLHPDLFDRLVQSVHEGVFWEDACNKFLGYSDGDVGQALFENWNFPATICEPVVFHHVPEQAGRHVEAAWIIHTANYLSLFKGTHVVESEPLVGTWETIAEHFGWTQSPEEKLAELAPEFEKASAFLDLFQQGS